MSSARLPTVLSRGLITLAALAWPVAAWAQTGPTKEADIDVNGTMSGVAIVVFIVVGLLGLLLTEPWNWRKNADKKRRLKKKQSDRDRLDV